MIVDLLRAPFVAGVTLCGAALATAAPLECVMENGEVVALELDAAAGRCAFGVNDGTLRDDGICRISNPQQRRVSLDNATGAVLYEDTDNDRIRRGTCRSG